MTEDRRNSRAEGELEVLEVDPHRAGRQLGLLGGGDQVDGEGETLLKLVTQSDLPVTRSDHPPPDPPPPHLPLYQSLPLLKGKQDDHLPEDQPDGVGLLVQVEAVLTADVVSEVEAALGAGDPSLRLSSISPELERQTVWREMELERRYLERERTGKQVGRKNVRDTPLMGTEIRRDNAGNECEVIATNSARR